MLTRFLIECHNFIPEVKEAIINGQDWFKAKLDLFKDDPEFLMEEAILDITEHVVAAMRDLGIDTAELARRMGVPEKEITRLLAGDREMFTREMLETLAKTLGEDPGDGIYVSVHAVDMSV